MLPTITRRAAALLAGAAIAAVAGGARAQSVAWSPDGRQAALPRLAPGGQMHMAIASADGTSVRPVPGGEGATFASWSPDGRFLALVGEAALLHDTRTGRTTRMAAGGLPLVAWRADSHRVAGVCRLDDGALQVYWHNATEGGRTFSLRLPVSQVLTGPGQMVWLPATDDVALVGGDDSRRDVLTAEAGEVQRITRTGDVLGLGLSGDGRRLVWARRGPNLRYILLSLYDYDLKSRGSRRLPFPDRLAPLNPNPRTAPASLHRVVFSPDGSRFVLTAMMGGRGAAAPAPAAFVVALSGLHVRLLHQSASVSDTESRVLTASWTPDSRRILLWESGTPPVVRVYNADGTGASRLPVQPSL